MKTLRSLFASVCFLPVAALAQSPVAQQTAAAIDRHYNALRSLQVQFSQSYSGMGMHRVESGTLLLTKGGKFHGGRMRWTYTQPKGKLFVLDGKYGYFYTPGETEIQRIPAKQLDDLRSPLALLLGHAELAKQLKGLTVSPTANGDQVLSGVPAGLEQRVASMHIVASAAGVIHRLEIEEIDGVENVFTFTNEQPDVPTPETAFAFEPPAGTHFVDSTSPM